MVPSDKDCELCQSFSVPSPTDPNNSNKRTGLFFAGLFGGAAVALSVICYPFIAPALRRVCLPYVPASTEQVGNVIKALSVNHKQGKLVDLGSGDGRIVLAAARNGFQSHGVELNSILLWYSKFSAFRNGLKNASFSREDLFKIDYSQYKNIVIFGVDEMMTELELLFEKSLRNQTKVVACRFPLPNWTPSIIIGEGINRVWVYEVEKK